MQTGNLLTILIMTLLILLSGNCESAIVKIARDDDMNAAGTSSYENDFNELSAYYRLRHQERQRWRSGQLQQRTINKEDEPNEVFNDFRNQFFERKSSKPQSRRLHNSRNLVRKRERNEALCESRRRTVHMNTPLYEYDPPFMVEIRCKSVAIFEKNNGLFAYEQQTCVYGLLRCVQVYKDVHFSKRKVSSNNWQPYVLPNVPSSCDCMWPIDQYGHQEL